MVVENILRESGAIYPQFFFFFNSPYVTFSLQSLGWPGLFTGFCVLSTQINVSDCSYTTLRVLLFQQMSRSRAGSFVIIGQYFKS